MLTGISEDMSPAIIHIQYNAYAQAAQMYILHQNTLNMANIEMFLLKIDEKNMSPYRKEHFPRENWFKLDNPDILMCSYSVLKPFKEILFNKRHLSLTGESKSVEDQKVDEIMNRKFKEPRRHKFILIVGDNSVCKNCQETISKMEKVVGMFSKFDSYQKALRSNQIEFYVGDVMSLPVENLIPGELPFLLYLGYQKGAESTAVLAGYYFDNNRFGRMVQLAVNKPNSRIEKVNEFMNIMSIRIQS